MAQKGVTKPVSMPLPLHTVLGRVDALRLEQPAHKLVGRHHTAFGQKVRDVHRAPIEDATTPPLLDANLVHQIVERCSDRHLVTLAGQLRHVRYWAEAVVGRSRVE